MPGRIIEPDIEEAFREAEEALRPKREEQIDQSRGNTGKRNVRVVKKHTTTQQERETMSHALVFAGSNIFFIHLHRKVYHKSFMYTITDNIISDISIILIFWHASV